VLDVHAADCWRVARRAGFRIEQIVRRGKWATALARPGGRVRPPQPGS
jgi:hypothetical protein